MARWCFILAAALFVSALLRDAMDAWVDATELPSTLRETSIEVDAADGTLLRAFPVADGLVRLRTQVHQTDPRFRAMLIRFEDNRFYRHGGVDPWALARAALQALRFGRAVSGGSTLTMQVARLLEDGSTGRWQGKIRQIRVALALERRLSKNQILDLYLTHAPYGGPLEGVRAASLSWFQKEPQRLSEAEAALLVALPQSPETRRPDRAPHKALSARNRVLNRLHESGIISSEALNTALNAPLPDRIHPMPLQAPHLADRLRAQDPAMVEHHTTLSSQAQSALQKLAERVVRAAPPRTSIAILAADHQSGEVLAYVGSAAYRAGRDGFVDMVKARRSPGSLLKPFVYGLAFDRGLAHPETLIHDGPVRFGTYAPQNFDRHFRGDVTIRKALQYSLNIPVVKLTKAMGPVRVLSTLRKGGTNPQLSGARPGLAISLGGLSLSLEELVQLYASLASGGTRRALSTGHAEPPDSARLMSRSAAWHIGDILGGLAPPPGAPRGALAYKTGTSYGHRDAWAIGFDGQHVIGVWLGRPDGTPVPGAFGGDLAAPVLFEAFARLKPGFAPLPGPPPETLILANSALPEPLRRFGPDEDHTAAHALDLVFPPHGARLALQGDLPIKLQGGVPPFTFLMNGAPSLVKSHATQPVLPSPGRGFTTVTVIDAAGQSAHADIELVQP